MRYILVLVCLTLIGCASLSGTSTIYPMSNGVMFHSEKAVEMSMEKDGVKYNYNSQTPSLMSRILSAITLGVVGTAK